MKQIIKGAFTKFETECYKCGCVFRYGVEDITTDGVDGHLNVTCPDCGFYTQHEGENGLPSSRKDIEPYRPMEMGEGWCAGCNTAHSKLFLYTNGVQSRWLCECCYRERQED